MQVAEVVGGGRAGTAASAADEGIWTIPDRPRALLVLAPGAGTSVTAPFYDGLVTALADDAVASLRFDFPYRRAGRPFPDREPVLRESWSHAFGAARAWAAPRRIPVAVGGRSMGGRIASLCVADGMPADALVLLSYPLHPPGRADRLRDEHLPRIAIPVLWVQGDRDPFATPALLEAAVAKVAGPVTSVRVGGGDHALRVRGERTDDVDRGAAVAHTIAAFLAALPAPTPEPN